MVEYPLQISNSCILNNTGRLIRSAQNTVTIINCTISKEEIERLPQGITTDNWEPRTQFIVPILGTQTEAYCQASYDAVGDLKQNFDTNEMTFMGLIYEGVDEDQDTFKTQLYEYMFIICFLNPNPSNDIWFHINS